MQIIIHSKIEEIDAKQWNNLLVSDNPFMRHEFLHGLENTGCIDEEIGWQSTHIAIYADATKKELLAAMPCYIKSHSYGEYIFDWAWADAHHRHGIEYYPKLLNAVPFTPATGQRWLIKDDGNSQTYREALLSAISKLLTDNNLSSFHSLFLTQDQSTTLQQKDYCIRHSNQYHWRNDNYKNFDAFLAKLISKKRKNIKRERRRVDELQVTYRWVTGEKLEPQHGELFTVFYMRTIKRYGAQAYLNLDFFCHLCTHFKSNTMLLFAYYKDKPIAAGLYFKSEDILYGRYWGALDDFDCVHFETCYYQPIQWCIENNYQSFEAGAQGDHKIARGLMPTTIYSAHWIQHPQLRDAIIDYVNHEQEHLAKFSEAVEQHSPFRNEI